MNNWYVVTGAPCSGKTTLINELERRGYHVAHEIAREYFSKEIEAGMSIEALRHDELALQERLLQLKLEREALLPKDEPVFFDRAIPDARAYLCVYGIPEPPHIGAAIDGAQYKAVFILDVLPLVGDSVRTESVERQAALDRAHEEAYQGHDYPVYRVPVMSTDERVDFILGKIATL